jgi:hypothetical protein
VEEFLAVTTCILLVKFQQHMEKFTLQGKTRENRKYVEYKNAYLPTMENN